MGEHSEETGCVSPNSWRSAGAEEEKRGESYPEMK